MSSDVSNVGRAFRLSRRKLLLVIVTVILMGALGAWLFQPTAVNVAVTVEDNSLSRYDDGAGNRPLAAFVRITNLSKGTVWFLQSTYVQHELVDEEWNYHSTSSGTTRASGQWLERPYRWIALHGMESYRFLAGPICEKASKIKVCVPFTTEWFPTEAHWVCSPVVNLLKTEQGYFPEVITDAVQEEDVLPLP